MHSSRRKQRAKSYFSHALHTPRFFVPLFNALFLASAKAKARILLRILSFQLLEALANAATNDRASKEQHTQ